MNRKDRRARASRGQHNDTMGASYTVLPDLPESVLNHPKYKEGQARAAKGEGFPPEYFAAIDSATRLVRQWVAAHPGGELRWLEWDGQRTFIAAGLDTGARYLADSPDAFALLEWLDGATNRQLSLNMAGWALRKLGMLAMPDGSTWGGEEPS